MGKFYARKHLGKYAWIGVSIKTISSSILCVFVNSKSTPVKASARLQGDGKDETGSAIIRIFLQ